MQAHVQQFVAENAFLFLGCRLFEKDDNLRIITYSNGVKVYINYSDEPAVIDGVSVEALDYQIKK